MAANSSTTCHHLYGAGYAVRRSPEPAGGGYQSFLDFNGDGIINTADNLQFRSRFNKALTWRV